MKEMCRVQPLLVACVAVILSTVNGDTSTASATPNVARSTTSFSVQQPQIQSIDQPSVGYTSQQSSTVIGSSIPTTYSVQQTLSVAQPSAVYSSSQQTNARAVQQSSPTSFQTSASYSVQHPQQSQQQQSSHARNNPSVHQQQTQSSSDTITYSQPQTSVFLQPSQSIHSAAPPNLQQSSFKSDVRAQVRSDAGSFVAPQPSQGHYSMGASYQVHGAQHKTPIRQRAAYGQSVYHNIRPMQYRRPVNWMATKRQHIEGPPSGPPGFHLSAPRPPPTAPIHPPKFHSVRSPPSFSGPPRPQHVIYTKPPPEEIYYGPNPPPLDYSPPRHYRPKVIRPIITEPTHYSTPQEPDNHDVMNDLDMYIPDDEPPSRVSSSSSSPMGSMMMPMMLLGLTLPALGIVFTYLSRRRRRRRDLSSPLSTSDEELDRYMSLLLKALEKSDKSA